MTTHRVNKQHIRSSCFKGPVKAKPSFSRIKLHVWAVVTTFYYSTSYILLEPSGTSHDFLIKTISLSIWGLPLGSWQKEYSFPPLSPRSMLPQPAAAHAWDGRDPVLLPPLLQQNTNIAMCLFPWPWNTSQKHFISSPAAARLNITSQTGCHPQVCSQLLKGMCTDTAPQLFLSADKKGTLM